MYSKDEPVKLILMEFRYYFYIFFLCALSVFARNKGSRRGAKSAEK